MDFVKAVEQEIEGLEASLKATPDPRLVKLHELRRVLAIYRGEANAEAPATSVARKPLMRPPPKGGRRPSPQRQRALTLARSLLAGRTEPTRTGDLYKELEFNGITLAGQDPANNLSALLYRHDEFVSHGRAGWTLREDEQAQRETAAPTAESDAAVSSETKEEANASALDN